MIDYEDYDKDMSDDELALVLVCSCNRLLALADIDFHKYVHKPDKYCCKQCDLRL
jgi:hypothetical protein